MGTLIKFIQWRRRLAKEAAHETAPYVPQYAIPSLERIKNPDPSKIQVTWVGHSTFLIQAAGRNILTDPIWSNRASPVQWAGPKRYARPGVAFTDLPNIDIALISHTHYDHLDRPTIKKLGASPRYILPTNLAPWFAQFGIRNVTELPWWSSTDIGSIRISAVPANHWSKRNLWGKEKAGWGGYVIECGGLRVYHSGDTAWFDGFAQIGARCGEIHAAMLPIGAYAPRWFMRPQHMDPADAVRAFAALGAERFIAMHWGTFKLTDEDLREPPELLREIWKCENLPDAPLAIPAIGETVLLERNGAR